MEQLVIDDTFTNYEEEILKKWKKIMLYQQLLRKEKDSRKCFDFVDGPPFVSAGTLHIGHMMVSFIKSSVLNFERMHKKKCYNKLGFDCHGLPIESIICKKLCISTKKEIEKMGIEQFNGECKKMISESATSWQPFYEQFGRFLDFTNNYMTMDKNFMESVWWSFKKLYSMNLIYKSFRILPYSYSCETPVSNFEAGLNYKDINVKSIYVFFQLKKNPKKGFIVWTTTPWTLPYNVALCVNKTGDYILCKIGEFECIIGKSSIKHFKIDEIIREYKGEELIDMEYEPLYDFNVKYSKVIADNFVSCNDEIGTNIVHIAPAFGEDDFRVCVEQKIITQTDYEKLLIIDSEGKINGKLVFDTDPQIIKELTERKLLIKIQQFKHQYPFCYRTDTPLIYKLVSSYFVNVTKIKEEMITLNKTIQWFPAYVGEKRFHNWLENARDWSISRNRYFGTPIPIWISEDGTEIEVIDSIEQLQKLTQITEPINDLHRETIDKLIIIKNGKILRRVEDVLDCWFESGSVPFAQMHFPFENEHYFDDKTYLSDFVCEGLDQTRGWFYTLLVLSTALFHKAPFKQVICTGLILDKHGIKISKKLGNFIDTNLLISTYGADVLRLYMIGSQVINGESLKFNEDNVKQTKQKIIQYINGVKFFIEHSINFCKTHDRKEIKYIETYNGINLMDKWILEEIYNLRLRIEKNMEEYKMDKIVDDILYFIENLTNWYIKLNRQRIKTGELNVLYSVLIDFSIITAPFMPFLSEYIYKHLNGEEISVHILDYPTNEHKFGIIEDFKKLQTIAGMVRNIRDKTKTSIRIPIKKCVVYSTNEKIKEMFDIIQEETNCLEFYMDKTIVKHKYEIKCISKNIGKRFKKNAKNIEDEINKLNQEQLIKIFNDCYLMIDEQILKVNEDYEILMLSDVELKENEINVIQDDITIIADMTYDEETHNLFQTRLFVRYIQNLRKEMDLHPWNKIKVHWKTLNNELIEKYIEIVQIKIENEMVYNQSDTYNYKFEWKTFNDEILIIDLFIELI